MHQRTAPRSARAVRTATFLLAAVTLWAAAPDRARAFYGPTGYIDLAPQPGSRFQLNAGIGGLYPGYGSLFVGGDILLGPRLSIPVGIQGFFFAGGGGFSADAGVRYRLASVLSLGGGIGGMFAGFSGDGWYGDGGDFHVWLELSAGKRFGRVGISASLRPTFGTVWGAIMLPVELDLAFFVSERWAVVVTLTGAPWIGYDGYLYGNVGGYLGLSGRL